MTLRNLQYFIAAATEQHFGRAAEALNISQPAISRQVRDLELEIGVTLFDRQSRGVKLSAAGEAFLEHANQITLAYEHACEHARRVNRGEVGRLRVGFNDFSIGYERVPSAFKQFRLRFPSIGLELVAMSSVKQLDSLSSGKLDAGFLYYYDLSQQFEHFMLGKEDILLALPSTHRLVKKSKIAIRDLMDEPFIGIRRDAMPHHHDRLIVACNQSGLTPRVVQETHNESTLLRLISVEMGLGLIRSSLASQLPKNVRVRAIAGISMDITFGLVWRRSDSSPALHRLISQVKTSGS